MPFARCSELDRLLSCAGSAVLGGEDEKSEAAKVAADWGTMAHHWKATGEIITVNGRENLPPLFEKKLRESGVRREDLWPDMIHETAIAVNPHKEYLVCNEGDRDAWKAEKDHNWLTGSCDHHWWMFGELYVGDLKTGKEATLEKHWYQLLGYTLGVARHYNYRGTCHVVVDHWPRYPVAGKVNRFGTTVSARQLDDFESRLARLQYDIWTRSVKLTAGDHCLWCPSKNLCSAYQENTNG